MSGKDGREERDLLRRVADFLSDEEGSLTEGELERGRDFVARMNAKLSVFREENRLSWMEKAQRELNEARTHIAGVQAKASRAEMIEYLSNKNIAARGLTQGLRGMSTEELVEIYQEQLKAERLDDL